jgi:hypothetical protein
MKRNKVIALGSAVVLVGISSAFAASALSGIASSNAGPSNRPVLARPGTAIIVVNKKHVLKAPKVAATNPATSEGEVAVGEGIVTDDLGAAEPETVVDSAQQAPSADVLDVRASRAAASPSPDKPTATTAVARSAEPNIAIPAATEQAEAVEDDAPAERGPSSSTAPTTAARRTTTTVEHHSEAPAITSAPRTATTGAKGHDDERETHEASGHDS